MSTAIILIFSFLSSLAVNKYLLHGKYSTGQVGRLALAVMLGFTGASHFIKTDEMVQMIPAFLPYKTGLVYASGLLEILAGLGLIFQRSAILTSFVLIAFFVAVLPANIIGSFKRVELGGMEVGPIYLFVRIPVQILFIWWAYYFGIYHHKLASARRSQSYSHT
jgi:uncharacterized membrane protein